eukprot:8540576-Pyramimonas_sp.AAC.1
MGTLKLPDWNACDHGQHHHEAECTMDKSEMHEARCDMIKAPMEFVWQQIFTADNISGGETMLNTTESDGHMEMLPESNSL